MDINVFENSINFGFSEILKPNILKCDESAELTKQNIYAQDTSVMLPVLSVVKKFIDKVSKYYLLYKIKPGKYKLAQVYCEIYRSNNMYEFQGCHFAIQVQSELYDVKFHFWVGGKVRYFIDGYCYYRDVCIPDAYTKQENIDIITNHFGGIGAPMFEVCEYAYELSPVPPSVPVVDSSNVKYYYELLENKGNKMSDILKIVEGGA